MNTSEEYIYNKEILDSKFLTEKNIKTISFYSQNDKGKFILINEKRLNRNGTIHEVKRGEKGWKAYPPDTKIKYNLDFIEKYQYNKSNIVEIETSRISGEVVAKNQFTFSNNRSIRKTYIFNKANEQVLKEIETNKYNSEGNLLESKIELPLFMQSALIKYSYVSKSLITKVIKQFINANNYKEQSKLFENKFHFHLDSLGRLTNSKWEVNLEGEVLKSETKYKYINKISGKISLIENFEKGIKVGENKYLYGKFKELLSYKIIDKNKEIEFKYEYKGSD